MRRPDGRRGRTVEGVRIDVLVVGCRPGGCRGGPDGPRAWARTVLVDKASFPRDKTCGDGLTAQALRLLEHLGVEVPAIARRATGRRDRARLTHRPSCHAPDARSTASTRPSSPALSSMPRWSRVRAPRASTCARRRAIVGARRGRRRRSAPRRRRRGRGDPFVVAADGHWSAVRRLREPGRAADLGTWHAFRQYFTRRRRPAPVGAVRGRPAPRVRVGVPAARRARRTSASACCAAPGVTGKRLKALWPDLLGRTSIRVGPRAARRARGTAPGVADPGVVRPRPPGRRSRPLHGRRGGRRRPDDRRGHRPGARDGHPRRRGDRGRWRSAAASAGATGERVDRAARARPALRGPAPARAALARSARVPRSAPRT